jgi:hypothetical protein
MGESDSGTRALERRVRVIEDFQAMKDPGQPERHPAQDSGPVPIGQKERLVLPTSQMQSVHEEEVKKKPLFPPVPPPPRVVTEEKLIRAQAAERRKIAYWALAIAFAGAGAFYYLLTQNAGRVLPAWRTIPGAPTVKAPPFRPDLRQAPKEPREPRETVKTPPRERPEPSPNDGCYDAPPRKKSGLLTVASSRGMSVRIDGVKVCGADFTRIPVQPGKRKVTVIQGGKNKEPFEAVQRFEVGKEVRVVPVFRGR